MITHQENGEWFGIYIRTRKKKEERPTAEPAKKESTYRTEHDHGHSPA
jgi:hypothetical protein